MSSLVSVPALVPVLAAALPFLGEIVTLFALSALVAYLCTRIRLVPIAGFLLTGIVVGPHALGLVQDLELVHTLAGLGVVLLLFEIGIEFRLAKLARLKRAIGLGGGLQVGLTIALVAGIGLAAGVAPGPSLYTGCLIALSSTAVVLGLLADRGETNTPAGQLSLSILIFQDLAIVAMVLLVPMLGNAGGSGWEVVKTLGIALLVIGAVLGLARVLVPPLLNAVARTRRPELFVLVVAALGLGTAWLVSLAGVSLELGAFLAGLVVSETDYREQALSDVLPFRSLFNAVFFVSVGMLLDLSFVVQHPLFLVGALGGVLVLKGLVTAGAVLALGYSVRLATVVGLALAQIGEFSFVLEQTGRAAGLSPFGLGAVGEQAFIVTAVILMLLTPGLLQVGPWGGQWLQEIGLGRLRERKGGLSSGGNAELEDHIVLVGFGPIGRRLARVLDDAELPFVIVDLNPDSLAEARAKGYQTLHGDATQARILEEAGIRRAKLCVVAINDASAAVRTVRLARRENPTVELLVRAQFLSEVESLRAAGADIVIPEEIETSVSLFSHVLQAYRVPKTEIREKIEKIRAQDYAILRDPESNANRLLLEGLDEEGFHTRTICLPDHCPAEGCTLNDLSLEEKYDLTVVAVRQGGETIPHPGGDLELQSGACLVLTGDSQDFAESAALFRSSENESFYT